MRVWSLGWENPMEKDMATHCSILAWRIGWTEEPSGLQSVESHRVRHDWSNLAHTERRYSVQFSSVAYSCLTLCDPIDCNTPGFPVHHQLLELIQTLPLSRWCHPTSLILCPSLLLLPSIFPSIRIFSNESVLHTGGQSTGVSASASVLPMNIQDWFPLGLTGWISL